MVRKRGGAGGDGRGWRAAERRGRRRIRNFLTVVAKVVGAPQVGTQGGEGTRRAGRPDRGGRGGLTLSGSPRGPGAGNVASGRLHAHPPPGLSPCQGRGGIRSLIFCGFYELD